MGQLLQKEKRKETKTGGKRKARDNNSMKEG